MNILGRWYASIPAMRWATITTIWTKTTSCGKCILDTVGHDEAGMKRYERMVKHCKQPVSGMDQKTEETGDR